MGKANDIKNRRFFYILNFIYHIKQISMYYKTGGDVMLFLKVKFLDLDLETNAVIVNEEDLKGTAYYPHDRVLIESSGGSFVGTLYSTKTMVNPGEVGVSKAVIPIPLNEGEEVRIRHAQKPSSIGYIRKKNNKHNKQRVNGEKGLENYYNHELNNLSNGILKGERDISSYIIFNKKIDDNFIKKVNMAINEHIKKGFKVEISESAARTIRDDLDDDFQHEIYIHLS